ncbi:N-acyl homoserine lactonase family protein [Moorella sp. Hama-1]|uniref:N-acyl homoserine lactonase family protein n=1 Tax=Moorella sp. Hama-1 TaxID=2138101 RepID=UPI000D65D3AF|nr:N-acyl homoserine lactonase family protein [Moorella sp. Hama-1]BCV21394.1 MBL fold metallo-hydrolase [Moorella sp. Hama-1]
MYAKVYILDLGTNITDTSVLLAGKGMGEIIDIPVFGIFIDHPQAKIVVDTGVNDLNSPGARNWKHKHSDKQTVVEQLKLHGVTVEGINYVISTHLHYDHAGNNHLFPNARIIVRREELEKAYVPITPGDIAYYREDFDRPLNYDLIPNGLDFELVDGVYVLSTPGHTAGSQSVLVKTTDGNVLYPGDAVYTFENWEQDILPGICYSGQQQWATMAKLKRIRDVILLPGHEPNLDLTRAYGV